tara:strand:- start:820 stop:1182 length:363 start_codon:yes stop_codon:yes gene_type:complete
MAFTKDIKGGDNFNADSKAGVTSKSSISGLTWVSDATKLSSWSKGSLSETSSFTNDAKRAAAFITKKAFNPQTDIYRGYFNLSEDYFDRIIESFRPIYVASSTPMVSNWSQDDTNLHNWT